MILRTSKFEFHIVFRLPISANQVQKLAPVGLVVLLDAYNDDETFQIPEGFLFRLCTVYGQQASSRIEISRLNVLLTEDFWMFVDKPSTSRGVIER